MGLLGLPSSGTVAGSLCTAMIAVGGTITSPDPLILTPLPTETIDDPSPRMIRARDVRFILCLACAEASNDEAKRGATISKTLAATDTVVFIAPSTPRGACGDP